MPPPVRHPGRSAPRGENAQTVIAHWHSEFDTSRDGIFLTDIRSTIVCCNRAATALIGLPAEEIIGNKCYLVVHNTKAPIAICPLKAVRRHKRSEVIRVSQGGFDLEIKVTPILDENGRFLGTVHVMKDITGHDAMKRKLQRSEEFLRRLLRNMSDAVAVIGRDYTIQEVNERFIALYGPAGENKEDSIGKKCYEATHRLSTPCGKDHPCPLKDILEGRYRSPYRHIHRAADGSKRVIELTAFPLPGPDGEVERIVEIHHDVTERERLHDELTRRESQLRATLYSIGDAVIATDKEGLVAMMNPVAEELTGWKESEALGRPLKEVFHILNEETRTEAEDPVSRVLREGIVIGLGNHTILIARDGTERPIADAGAPILDIEGNITGVVLVFRDQSEERRAQRAIQEARQLAEGIVETVREPLVVLDSDLRIVSANRAFYRTFRTTPKTTKGRLLYELDDGQWNIPELRRLLGDILPKNTSFEDFEIEHEFVRIGRRTMRLNARRLSHEGGKALILLAIEDITEREQALQALRDSEERYRNLVTSLPMLIYALSTDGKFTFLNPAFETITGWPAKEWLGRSFEELILPEDHPLVRERFARALNTTRTRTTITIRIRTANGEPRTLEVLGIAHRKEGRVIGVTGFAHDITERVRHAREMEALAHIAEAVGETTSLRPLLERILKAACDAIPSAEKGSILLAEPDGTLRIHALHGYTDKRIYDMAFAGTGGYSALTARERRPLIISDARRNKTIRYNGEIEEARAIQSAIAVPLMVQERLIGVITLDNASRKNAFREHDLRLLINIASTAALVIDNARFLEETLRKKAETTALLETSLALDYLDLESTMHTIGRRAKELFDADGCRIFLLEPDGETLRCLLALHKRARAVKEMRIKVGQGVTGDIARTGRAEIVNDMLGDPRAIQVPGTPREQEAMMFTPLTDQGRVIGVMSISRLEGKPPFQPQDLELFKGLGALAASAITSARLYEEIRRRLIEMESLHRAGQSLLAARLDPKATYAALHKAVKATMPCEAFAIVLESEDGEKYHAVYLYDKGGHASPRDIPKGEGLSGQVISSGQSICINDYTPESDIPAVHFGDPEPVRSILAVPIPRGNRTIGMLTTQSYRSYAYDESHRIFLETLANHFAAVLENTHLYQQTRARLRELEVLYESARSFSNLMSPEEIGQRLVDIMAEHLEWHHAVIRTCDPKRKTFRLLAFHLPKEIMDAASREEIVTHLQKSVPDIHTGLSGRAVREGRALRVPDVSKAAGYTPTYPGIRSGMYVPIKGPQGILGVISVESTRSNAFSESDERLLVALANQTAIALANAHLFQQIQQQVKRLSMLRTIDSTITATLDLRLTLNIILEQATNGLEVDAACILLHEPHLQTLHYAAERGFRTTFPRKIRIRLGEGYAGRVALERRPLYIPYLSRDTGSLGNVQHASCERFVAYAAIPLIAKGEVKGVLEVFHRSPLDFTKDWKRFFETLAQQAAIAIDNAQLFASLERRNIELTIAYDTTIESLIKALELRDKDTEGHTKNVTELTIRLARAMGLKEEEIIHIRRGALLHDLGKIAVPDAILHKAGPLSEEEWKIMRRHPQYAHEILSPIAYLRPALDIPYCHHERWDGSGYPRRLKGEEIPLPARIFAVADVWDALTSDRPYRKAWPREKAIEYIRQQAGKHFDPEVVQIFLEIIEQSLPRTTE